MSSRRSRSGGVSMRITLVLVGRGDDPDVHPNRHLAAHAVELALGEYTQQAGLQGGRHVADLVEEQRTAIGLLEAADAPRLGAREGALLVPEQL